MKFAVRKRRAPLIIIVSLVDILIILLIFFVVSTTFKKDQPEVQINLPESKTAQKKPGELEHAIVSIDQDDQIKLDGRAVERGRPRRRSARFTGGAQIHARAASGQESFLWHHH